MKYEAEKTVKKVEVFISEMTAIPDIFWKHCSIHHIAVLLDVHRDTVYDWKEKFPEFSDIIKKWQSTRDALFLQLKNKNSAWIFLAKNWLGMTDKQDVSQSGDISIKWEEIMTDKRPKE